MSKPIEELLNVEMTDNLKKYFINFESLKQVMGCVADARFESNIYKAIVSFEDAQVVEAAEVPVGDEKQKMAYLLEQATTKATALLSDTLNQASEIVKTWSADLVLENQDQRLQAALGKLKNPVKTAPIPTYSRMSDGQRTRTQAIFKKHLNSEEPVSIDYITEAIDRYNADASVTVLSKALGVSIAYKNSVVVYDESSFNSVSTPEVLTHLTRRFHSFKQVCDELKSAGNEMSVTDFLTVLRNSDKDKNANIHNKISELTRGLNFTAPLDDYTAQSKESADYDTVKPYVSGINHLNPMTQNTLDRMNALCKMVSTLGGVHLDPIDLKQSNLTAEEAYDALSTYFNYIEEFTQCLVVYMYVTQITIRNHKVLDEVISICDRLVEKLTSLFTEVNDNLPEDGEVSQESFRAAVNYIKAKLPGTKNPQDIERQQKMYFNLSNRFEDTLTVLDKFKLRGSAYLAESALISFRDKHAESIQKSHDINISEMSSNEVFNFMMSDYMSKPNRSLNDSVFTLNLFNSKDRNVIKLRELLLNEATYTRLFADPFATTTTKSYAVTTQDLLYHLEAVEEELRAGDIDGVHQSLRSFDYFLREGSYYANVDKLSGVVGLTDLTNVPSLPYTLPEGQTYTLGYGELDRSSQELLMSAFNTSTNTITLNSLRRNPILSTLVVHLPTYQKSNLASDAYMGAPSKTLGYKQMESVQSRLEAVKASLKKNKVTDQHVYDLMDAIANDVKGAMSDVTFRNRMSTLTLETAYSTNVALCEIYNKTIPIFEEFMTAIK